VTDKRARQFESTDDDDDAMGELCDFCGRNTGRLGGCTCADGKPRRARPRHVAETKGIRPKPAVIPLLEVRSLGQATADIALKVLDGLGLLEIKGAGCRRR
jgi:hypothetical protein